MPSVTTPSGVIRARTTRELFKKAKEAREQRKRDKKNKSNSNDGTPKVGDDIVIQEEGTNKEFTGRVVESPTGEVLAIAARTVPRKEQIARENERKRSKAIQQARENLRPVGQEPRREIVINDQTPVEVRRALPIFSVLQRNTGGELRVSRETNKSNKNMLSDDGRQQKTISRDSSVDYRLDPNLQQYANKQQTGRTNSKIDPRQFDPIGISNRNVAAREKKTQSRLEAQIIREQNIISGREKLYSRLGIGREDKSLGTGDLKNLARFPIETATGFYVLGGRAASAVDTLSYFGSNKRPLIEAGKETPRASVELVKESFNPKTPEGRLNLALVAAPIIKSGIRAGSNTGTVLEGKAFRNPKTGRFTYVGEGKFRGRAADFAVVEKATGTQTTINVAPRKISLFGREITLQQGKRLSSFGKGQENLISSNVVRSESIQPVFRGKGFERSRFLTEEVIRQDFSRTSTTKGTSVGVDVRTSDIVKTRVDVTPEVVTRELVTPRSKQTIGFETTPADIQFGKGTLPRDTISIEPAPEGVLVTKTRTPKFTQKGTISRGGIGTLEITEPASSFRRGIEGLAASKRAQSTFTLEKPKVSVNRAKISSSISQPAVSIPSATNFVFRPTVLPVFNFESKIAPKQSNKVAQNIDINSRQKPIINTRNIDISRIRSDNKRDADVKTTFESSVNIRQTQIPKQKSSVTRIPSSVIRTELSPASAPPTITFKLPPTLLPLFPFAGYIDPFDTPSGYTPRRKKQAQTFTPSFSATLFDIRGKVDTKQRFTGLGFRPIPLR